MSTCLIEQAMELLVKRRWPMVPSTGNSKKPCVKWKDFQNRLPTVDELRDWDKQFTPPRWGVVTGKLGGIVVIDFDGDKGRTLLQTWKINPHVRTGSGGFHFYIQHPGWRVPTMNAKTGKASWPWPGLDIRGDGGFAVLLGRNNNGRYVRLRELIPEPFAALPEEVRTFLSMHSNKDNAVSPSQREGPRLVAPISKRVDSELLIRNALAMAYRGGRNNAGFWLACQLRDNGYDIGEAESALRQYLSRVSSTNAKGTREAYTEHEMAASLSQAYSRRARDPWSRRNPRPHGRATSASSREYRRAGKYQPAAGDRAPVQHLGADNSDSLGLYVGHTGEPLLGHMGEPLSRVQYSRIPREVSSDPRLKSIDIRVYAVLAASCWQGSVVSLGKRQIAKQAPCAERLVVASLKRLEATGHIQKHRVRRGERGRYLLLSRVFGQKQRAGVEETIMTPDGRKRLASVRREQGTALTGDKPGWRRSDSEQR